jgi:hypothetical protein
MPVANRALLVVLALACAGCGGHSGQATDNAVSANGMDIETLPPDESATTPTNDLENGVDEPPANTADLNSD